MTETTATNGRRMTLNDKLGRKIILTVVLVALAPLLFISGVFYYYYHVAYRGKVAAHLVELVDRHAQSIDGFLNEKLANIDMKAALFSKDQLAREVVLNDVLQRLQRVYSGSFVDLGIIDADGTQVAYAGPFHLKDAHYDQAEWFKQAMDRPNSISDVFSGIRGIPHFIVTSRHMADGKPWLLRATIDFAGFNQRVRNIRIGKTGLAFIINRKGEFQTERRFDEAVDLSILPELAELKFTDNKPQFLERARPQGGDYFFVAKPLKGGDWILVLQQERDDALENIVNARRIALVTLLIGALAIVATAVILVGRMLSRVFVAERQQDVMAKQIVETGKLAAIGELASGIAHEINNPVAIMSEYAGWIQDLMGDARVEPAKSRTEIEDALREIVLQGQRCKEITHKLLSFARRTDSVVKSTNINALIEEIVGLSTQKARFGKVTLRTELDRDLPELLVSPTEIQQVVLNLVNNALDAMNKSEGVIVLRSHQEGEFAVIDVEDNGQGIPPANLERIFEPFFTTKPVGKGTGLGLSICYGIINKMGGTITVESEVGSGTVFRVRIPMKREVQAE